MAAPTILVCIQDMSKNILESGGDINNSQECNFVVNGKDSKLVPPPLKDSSYIGNTPDRPISEMSNANILNEAKMLMATNAPAVAVGVVVFIAIVYWLWKD
jgi:hypothetical protein